jgi:hypothetical protein
MRLAVSNRVLRVIGLMFVVALLAACGGRNAKSDASQLSGDIPTSFDVVLLADKDDQFDYQEAPLTAQDLRSALNYRKEQALPMATVLLKRGEKQKVKGTHIVALARISNEMGFKAYLEEKGRIDEIRTTTKSEM